MPWNHHAEDGDGSVGIAELTAAVSDALLECA
jgi:hypothetical protein